MSGATADVKKCSKCKVLLPVAKFNRNCAAPCGLRHDCTDCQGKRQHEYYLRTRKLKGKPKRYEDLSGRRFGRLIVIEPADKLNDKLRWRCICDCGNEKVVRASCLKRTSLGRVGTQSCGCLARETSRSVIPKYRLPPGESLLRDAIRTYKQGASRRQLIWDLTDNDCRLLFAGTCHYCGIEPSMVTKHGRSHGVLVRNGIDRIDSSKGYTLDNVLSCCAVCNEAKNDRGYDDFLAWAKRVAEHHE